MHIAVAALLAVAVPALSGCGGETCLVTVPDQLAPAGGQTAAVVRFQRNEFYTFHLPMDKAPVRMRAGDAPERCAYTNEKGYAGAMVPSPKTPGRYDFVVSHLDQWGDEVMGRSNYYAWDPNAPSMAVDLDCLPGLAAGGAGTAPEAVRRLMGSGTVLYLTQRSPRDLPMLHLQLGDAGYPDGPVLCWQREDWRVVYETVQKVKMPRVVVESRLVSALPSIRQSFPKLNIGACDSAIVADAFKAAGMQVVDFSGHGGPSTSDREWWRWIDLRKKAAK